MSILAFLFKLVNPLGDIATSLARAYEKKQDAVTDRIRIAADVEIGELEAKRAVLIAETRTPINQIVRVGLTLPAGLFIWKVIVYDKLLGAGVTDGLSQNLWYYVFMVLGFYFVDSVTTKLRKRM